MEKEKGKGKGKGKERQRKETLKQKCRRRIGTLCEYLTCRGWVSLQR